MPELHYLDNQNDALRSTANTLGGLAYQIPQLRLAAERIRREQVLNEAQRILYGAQAEQARAHTQYYNAQATEQQRKTTEAQEITQNLRNAGTAASGVYLSQRPAFMEGGPTLSGQADKNMSDFIRATTFVAGNNPQRAQQAVQGSVADYSSGLANNAALAQAVVTRSQLMHNIPANDISQNLATGQITPGAVSVPAAGMVTMPGQTPVLGQQRTGNSKSPEQLRLESAYHAASRLPPYSSNSPSNVFNAIMGLPIPTNASTALPTNTSVAVPPSMQLSPGGVPKRIRVQSKDGRTGTMNSDEPLPDGWSIVQPAQQGFRPISLESLGTNAPAAGKGKPPRAVAADYLNRFGDVSRAKAQLQQDGYDLSGGYAD